MIQSLLIANRGEIACRVLRTARKHGHPHQWRSIPMPTRKSPACALCRRGGAYRAQPRAGELSGGLSKIIAAAKATGAEAIHPGYGFLSENAEFAQAVIDAGLVWVGPKPASHHRDGPEGRGQGKLMVAAGVPVTPGYMGEDQDPEPALLRPRPTRSAIPVLIKAVAGGGGKGMRKVEASSTDFALTPWPHASARRRLHRSAKTRVLIEKYILSPAPHRGTGLRRQPRQCRPPVRARLLAAAPPPEGDRGSPRPGHGRSHPRGASARRR